jgi:hypothetical protein
MLRRVCRRFPGFCLSYLTAFCGSNPQGNVEDEMVPLVFRHLPAGTSVKVMSQWAQVGQGLCCMQRLRHALSSQVLARQVPVHVQMQGRQCCC